MAPVLPAASWSALAARTSEAAPAAPQLDSNTASLVLNLVFGVIGVALAAVAIFVTYLQLWHIRRSGPARERASLLGLDLELERWPGSLDAFPPRPGEAVTPSHPNLLPSPPPHTRHLTWYVAFRAGALRPPA